MRKRKVVLVLMALVLVTALGAKMYSDITMGDDDWIGLASDAGRIVFDNQAVDEVIVMDAKVGIGTTGPNELLHLRSATGHAKLEVESTTDNASIFLNAPANEFAYVAFETLGVEGWEIVRPANQTYLEIKSSAVSPVMVFEKTTGNVGIGDATPSYDLDVHGDIRATDDILAGDDITAGGEIHADTQISSSGHVLASGDVAAIGNVFAHHDVIASGDVVANFGTVYGQYVYATSVVSSSGYVYAYTSVIANGDVFVGDDILVYDDVVADGDVSANGNVTAGVDVTAGGSVFIGSEEDGDEDGDHMLIRADNTDGGCATWAEHNFTGVAGIFTGSVGPEMVLHVRWLTHSDTTEAYTSGETYLVNDSEVVIASDGVKEDLALVFNDNGLSLWTDGSSGHYYDVVLQLMWVED